MLVKGQEGVDPCNRIYVLQDANGKQEFKGSLPNYMASCFIKQADLPTAFSQVPTQVSDFEDNVVEVEDAD